LAVAFGGDGSGERARDGAEAAQPAASEIGISGDRAIEVDYSEPPSAANGHQPPCRTALRNRTFDFRARNNPEIRLPPCCCMYGGQLVRVSRSGIANGDLDDGHIEA